MADRALPPRAEVVVVGAGLSGLGAARALHRAGRDVLVIERDDAPGGRVRTDLVDGFRLDRGFQVLLTAYPEARRQLDLDALRLQEFDPGALVFTGRRFHAVGDPLRRPATSLSSAIAPIGSVADKLRLAHLLIRLRREDPRRMLRAPESTTIDHLHQAGFGDVMIERFFRPLFGGIQLDPELRSSSRMFEVVLACLARGSSAVPAEGMQAIPDQLAGDLPPERVRTGTAVRRLCPGRVETDRGAVEADRIVVAADEPTAAALLGRRARPGRPASCVWFGADAPPVAGRRIVLDGSGEGPALNVAVMSNVAPSYAPAGRALVAAACPGTAVAGLEAPVRAQLRRRWGPQVESWQHLRTDVIPFAQPDSAPPLHPRRRVALGDGLFVCGDHRDTPSIQGALFSGARCAAAVLESLR
jgi:protoporphyrinogen oxidase